MLSLLAVAAITVLPTPQPIADHAKPVCNKEGPQTVGERKPVRAQKLNALPNADLMLGVLRSVDGCSRPAIVRYDIGSAPKRH